MNKITTGITLMLSLSLSTAAFAAAPKADNTAQNRGAMRKDAVTAEKQKNDKSDVEVLAEVRRVIEAQKGLSMDAKNAKILYSKGLLTLRGPVDSEEEKSKVIDLVKSCEGVTEVKDLLTVSAKAH